MKLINLTPHTINLYNEAGDTVLQTYPSEGVCRASTAEEIIDTLDGFPVKKVTYGNLTGIPEPQPDTRYIVSVIAQQACPERIDLISPDTGSSCVRDVAGKILGVKGFVRV